MKLEQLNRVPLGVFPTPLQRMSNLEKELGHQGALYIKRDDMTDVAMCGNKVRKLEYLVADALAQGCTTLLTIGGPQTNHGRLTVGAAVRYGLKSALILKGERPDYCSGNLVLDRMMGAELFFAPSDPDAAVAKTIKILESRGEKVYFIPAGGSNLIGIAGYIQMVPELIAQCKEQNIAPEYLVCASGSMGTFGGLWLGAKYYNAPFEVLPVAVNPATPNREEKISAYINSVSEHYELGITSTPETFKLNFGRGDISYSGPGYNVPDAETRKHMNLLARTEAIFLDPCYSGKGFHGFVDMVQNVLPAAADAIFLHTGGTPAIWTKEHLDAAQEELWSGPGITVL